MGKLDVPAAEQAWAHITAAPAASPGASYRVSYLTEAGILPRYQYLARILEIEKMGIE